MRILFESIDCLSPLLALCGGKWAAHGSLLANAATPACNSKLVTSSDYVAFFCQFFGYTDNPVLAPIAQEPCRCQRYRHDSDHVNCCSRHSANWLRDHEHVLRAIMAVLQAAGYACSIKHVPTSDGIRRADLHVVGTRLMGKDDLIIDYTSREKGLQHPNARLDDKHQASADAEPHIIRSAAQPETPSGRPRPPHGGASQGSR